MAKQTVSPNGAKAVHFTLQGKGGVGKSLVSALLAQYFRSLGVDVKCVDTDPVNKTFVHYKALNAHHVDLLDGSKINERAFDGLMERLLSEDGTYVIDNGASTFVPLSNYLAENQALQMLTDSGYNVFVHSVVTGGQALLDTLQGFSSMAQLANPNSLVVWLNEFFGPIEKDQKTFEEMRAYTDNTEKVRGIVRIPKRNQDTFGKDIEEMTSQKLTFDEVLSGSQFTIMAKQRIRTVQRDIFTQLETVGF